MKLKTRCANSGFFYVCSAGIWPSGTGNFCPATGLGQGNLLAARLCAIGNAGSFGLALVDGMEIHPSWHKG
jgi:hypothetical protein